MFGQWGGRKARLRGSMVGRGLVMVEERSQRSAEDGGMGEDGSPQRKISSTNLRSTTKKEGASGPPPERTISETIRREESHLLHGTRLAYGFGLPSSPRSFAWHLLQSAL
jgi:hypothetical protein